MSLKPLAKTQLIREINKTYAFIKRIVEVLFSIFLLILTAPIMVLVMIVIKLESKGPILYKQVRAGLNGVNFSILKLRSMADNAESNGPKWAEKNDPRVTNVGRIIRKTRIDEIPQLINVIKGDMSLIGPRPERPFFVEKFSKEVNGFKDRLLVRPGLTGWAQVNGGYDASPAQKFELDMFYIKNRSLKLDLQILFRTLIVIVSGDGAR